MRFTRIASSGVAALAVLVIAERAQAELEVSAEARPRQVESGEPFTVDLQALVERGEPMPGDPQLRPPTGASMAGGPQVATSMVMLNGHTRVGLQATWQLIASKPGRVRIPAPSVLWGGKRVAARPLEVEVVPATGRTLET